jgi:hypothetical protein
MRRALVLAVVAMGACSRPGPSVLGPSAAAERLPSWPSRPRAAVGAAFRGAWSDGRAEISGYRARVNRYGEMRDAELVLIYVTEPMDRRTWVKDDDVTGEHRVEVLKLNASLKFQTGVYPYSVLTSVFAPMDRYQPEAFAPAKITLSVQEWCGHVFHGVWPGDDHAAEQLMSYFAQEGERRRDVPTPSGALYEDALLIQLRELDGPFAGGHDWRGALVPSLWSIRRAHRPTAAVDAAVTRSRASRDGVAVHRFVLRYGDVTRSIDVEADGAHRVLGWEGSDGEAVSLLRTARLPYWQLNHNGDEAQRALFGLGVDRGVPDGGALR